MKGRGKPPSSPESEESWTVDCPCGVNYDDGEEMVDCDECGVWVHTSCCRILKGHTSYVCDKCKFKKKESEESEVAQLLVELPSKAPPLENKVFSFRPGLTVEERTHVQGIPGGDSSFFIGVSKVFSRELWKYTGYVPKVFRFHYNELPAWSDDKSSSRVLFGDCGTRTLEDFSNDNTRKESLNDGEKLLNMDVLPPPESQTEKNNSPKDKSNRRDQRKESKHRHRLHQEENMKVFNQSINKRRRDETSKRDVASKKRSRNAMSDNNHGMPKRVSDDAGIYYKSSRSTPKSSKASRNLVTPSYIDDVDMDTRNNTSKLDAHGPESPGSTMGEPGSINDSLPRVDHSKPDKPKYIRRNAVSINNSDEREITNAILDLQSPVLHSAVDMILQTETNSGRRDQDESVHENNNLETQLSKSKEQLYVYGNLDKKGTCTDHSHNPVADPKEMSQRKRMDILRNTRGQNENFPDLQFDENIDTGNISQDDVHASIPLVQGSCEQLRQSDIPEELSLSSRQQKRYDNKQSDQKQPRALKAEVMEDELPGPHSGDELLTDKLKNQSGEHFAREETPKMQICDPSSPMQQDIVTRGHPQLIIDENVKLSPSSAQTGHSKSADLSSPTVSGNPIDSKHQGFTRTDSVSPTSEKVVDMQSNSTSKASFFSSGRGHSSCMSNSHVKSQSSSKHKSRVFETKKSDISKVARTGMPEDLMNLSKDPKEPMKVYECKTSKNSSKVGVHGRLQSPQATLRVSGTKSESGVPVASPEQIVPQSKHSARINSTGTTLKPEKSGGVSSKHLNIHSSPRHGNTDLTPPALNDEELALLLHQELNSSPRVARVARVRQSGQGLHPLSSKKSATVFSSNAGQKDHHLMFRRKNKDELQGEVGSFEDVVPVKQEKVSHSTARKDRDTAETNKPHPPTVSDNARQRVGTSDGQPVSDVPGHNEQVDGERRSLVDNVVTLPGLIEEILKSKGNNVTYDGICDEVLPHWSKLRKPNGDRYAYTSHRQAVLDCLRNRSAWSHLIDRGPKTNLGRKRRRPESVASESENGDQGNVLYDDWGDDHRAGKASKDGETDGGESWLPSDSNKDGDLSLPDEVPKGKRRARQGRKLASKSRRHKGRSRNFKDDRTDDASTGSEDELDELYSEDASTSSDEDIPIHRSGGSIRHTSRNRGSSPDSDDDDMEI